MVLHKAIQFLKGIVHKPSKDEEPGPNCGVGIFPDGTYHATDGAIYVKVRPPNGVVDENFNSSIRGFIPEEPFVIGPEIFSYKFPKTSVEGLKDRVICRLDNDISLQGHDDQTITHISDIPGMFNMVKEDMIHGEPGIIFQVNLDRLYRILTVAKELGNSHVQIKVTTNGNPIQIASAPATPGGKMSAIILPSSDVSGLNYYSKMYNKEKDKTLFKIFTKREDLIRFAKDKGYDIQAIIQGTQINIESETGDIF